MAYRHSQIHYYALAQPKPQGRVEDSPGSSPESPAGRQYVPSSGLVPFSRDSRIYGLIGLATEDRCVFKLLSQQLCLLWQSPIPDGVIRSAGLIMNTLQEGTETDPWCHLIAASQKVAGTKDLTFILEMSTVPHTVC